MSEHNVSDRAREIRSWPSASCEQLRNALLGDRSDVFASFPASWRLEMAFAAARGHLVDAGRLSEKLITPEVLADARTALRAGRLRLDAQIKLIIFSAVDNGIERTILMGIKPASGDPATTEVMSLAANVSPDGQIALTHVIDAAEESDEAQKAINEALTQLSVSLLYLLICKSAVQQVKQGRFTYSCLDVERAIRLKTEEKIRPRPLTLGELRSELTEKPAADFRAIGYEGRRLAPFTEASKQAHAGRIFILDGLPHELVRARADDAMDAVKSGALRPPYSSTFVLMKYKESDPAAHLLGCFDEDPVSGKKEPWMMTPWLWPAGSIDWRAPYFDGDDDLSPGELTVREAAEVAAVILSLIADSRSSITRVMADDKLNKARIKRGKAPIPSYWKIEPPKPTVLVPNAPSSPAIAAGPKGTHASPRPHDRRGHPRRLSEERVVWVRSTKVNALIPHLTRGRSYYEVKTL